MFIVYQSDREVIVTTKEKEEEMLKSLFLKADRDIKNYDREEINDEAVQVRFRVRIG